MGKIVPDRDVLVVGSRIVSIDKSKATIPQIPIQKACDKDVWSECPPISVPWGPTAPPKLIDARGKTLLPGLWDMHAHVGDNDGLLNLAAGVTTVRDLANDTDTLLARRRRIADGKEIGTRIVIAGIIDGRGPYQGPTKVLVSTEAEARAAVDNYKRLGYVQIKIYSSVPPAIVPAIIDEAHKNGLRVSGHIPAEMTAAQCVKLGYDEIQHINFLVLNFFPEIKNTNTIARLTKPGELAASLDLTSPQVQSFIKLLQDHHTKLDLTLSIFEDQYMSRIGQIPPGYQAVANRLPAQVRRGLLTQGMTPPPGMDDTYKKSFAKMMEFTGLLYRSGLSIEAGTDSMAGFALDRELELDVKAGIPAAQVLQNATLNAAKIMSMDKDLGSITPGKLADLTLVDGDPTKNISDIRKTAVVVKDGVLYYPAELYTELGVAPISARCVSATVARASSTCDRRMISCPPAIAPRITNGSRRDATASGKAASGDSCVQIPSQAKIARTPAPAASNASRYRLARSIGYRASSAFQHDPLRRLPFDSSLHLSPNARQRSQS